LREKEVKCGKVVPVHAMKAYRGNTCTAPLIHNQGTRWRWLVNFKPGHVYPQERTPGFTVRETWWTPLSEWTFRRRKNWFKR